MLDLIRQYKQYLEADCRFSEDTIVRYVGNVPVILDKMGVREPTDIDARRVLQEWQTARWEATDEGIRISDDAQKQYLPAFKEFLRYLEDRGLLGEERISDIIRLPQRRGERLNGLLLEELRRLQRYLAYHVSNDSQRRDTALLQMLLNTGCSLPELLSLEVGRDGQLDFSRHSICGSFEEIEGTVYVVVRARGWRDRRIRLEPRTLTYLRFYLENRSPGNAILFARTARRGRPGRLAEGVAARSVERLVARAGIRARRDAIVDVLRMTAVQRGLEVLESDRPLLSSDFQRMGDGDRDGNPGDDRGRNGSTLGGRRSA